MRNGLHFKSLDDLTQYFNTDKKCVEYFEQVRWNGERCCPHCGGLKTYVLKGNGKYKCGEKGCRQLFSITTGTYFENTKLPLRKWLIAMYLCLNHKKGVSSLQLAETIGVTQKTAWFVLHRIREIVQAEVPQMLQGEVEVDETYIGGKEKNRHKSKKLKERLGDRTSIEVRKQNSKWYEQKDIVIGGIERGTGRVVAKHIPTLKGATQLKFMRDTVRKGSTVITDEHHGYGLVNKYYNHHTVVHSKDIYVDGDIYTNTIENFWSIVKRCLYGTYHQVSGKHLQSYLNEFTFRFSTRHNSGHQRFRDALNNCHGRLKYHDLIARNTKKD